MDRFSRSAGAKQAYFLQPQNSVDRYASTGHTTQCRVYKCAACPKQYFVLIGTVFEGSKIPLSKWLLAIHLKCSPKIGVLTRELHRNLEISKRCHY